jgi:hypothetical protein
MGEMRNTYKILVGKPEGKKLRERYRRRWEDNIKMDLTEIGWEVVDWVQLVQDMNKWWAVLNTVMNLRKAGNFLTI